MTTMSTTIGTLKISRKMWTRLRKTVPVRWLAEMPLPNQQKKKIYLMSKLFA